MYADFKDQRLYTVPAGAAAADGGEPAPPTALTPPSDAFASDAQWRFADFAHDKARNRLVCVREDHTDPAPANVRNDVVALALDGSGDVTVLATGADFYAAPRVSPDGRFLAYVPGACGS